MEYIEIYLNLLGVISSITISFTYAWKHVVVFLCSNTIFGSIDPHWLYLGVPLLTTVTEVLAFNYDVFNATRLEYLLELLSLNQTYFDWAVSCSSLYGAPSEHLWENPLFGGCIQVWGETCLSLTDENMYIF